MAFRAEITVSGLFIATLKGGDGDRPDGPTSVDVLALKDRSQHGHRVSLNFLPDDVSDAQDYRFDLGTDANGWHTVSKGAAGKSIEIEAKVGNTVLKAADRNTFQAQWAADPTIPVEGALDWLPNLTGDFAISKIEQIARIDSNFNFWAKDSNFMGILRLPAGRLKSRALIAHPAHFKGPSIEFPQISKWEITRYSSKADPVSSSKFLAEQLVWSLDDVEKLTLKFGAARELTFDDAMRALRGEERVVRLSYTNLPTIGGAGRFGAPGHFSHFLTVEDQSADIRSEAHCCGQTPGKDWVDLDRDPAIPGGITNPSGSCPPAILRINDTP